MKSKQEKKNAGVLVLLTKNEKMLFKRSCKHFKLRQSTFLRTSALKLIMDYEREQKINITWHL